jgi:hypothetical protein
MLKLSFHRLLKYSEATLIMRWREPGTSNLKVSTRTFLKVFDQYIHIMQMYPPHARNHL